MSLATWDWPAIAADLDASGCAVTPRLLTPAQCGDLVGLYDRPELLAWSSTTPDWGPDAMPLHRVARSRFHEGQESDFSHAGTASPAIQLPETRPNVVKPGFHHPRA